METYKFKVNVYLEGEDVGEVKVEIPHYLYEQVCRDAPQIDENPEAKIRIAQLFGLDPEPWRTFQQTMEGDSKMHSSSHNGCHVLW